MAEKKDKTKKEEEDKIKTMASERLRDYFALSSLLFGYGDKSPYDINELKEDNMFYQPAKDLSKELGIDWEKMTHEESNRIMLALLDDYFNQIKIDEEHRFLLQVNVEEKKNG